MSSASAIPTLHRELEEPARARTIPCSGAPLEKAVTPRIAVVLPRNTTFGQAGATSVDLCVRDLVRHSRYAASTQVICDWLDTPFDDVASSGVRYDKSGGNAKRIAELIPNLRAARPDLIVVHQHLPTATRLRDALSAPVLLYTHNFLKRSQHLLGRLGRQRDYGRLDGISFVSEACRDAFERDYLVNTTTRTVVENGLDMQTWRAHQPRSKTIVAVGRATPEKGILESLQALSAALPAFPDWRAEVILSEAEKAPEYFAALKAVAARNKSQIVLNDYVPHEQVQAKYESAAIALVLSKWREPFGRTALEAHAAGAALISSGTGGLREVSGQHALYVDPNNPAQVQGAIAALIQDETLRARLGHGGRRRVETFFDARVVASKLDDFYAAALQMQQRTVA